MLTTQGRGTKVEEQKGEHGVPHAHATGYSRRSDRTQDRQTQFPGQVAKVSGRI